MNFLRFHCSPALCALVILIRPRVPPIFVEFRQCSRRGRQILVEQKRVRVNRWVNESPALVESGTLCTIIRSSDILISHYTTEAVPMANQETAKVGKRGTVVLPAALRRRFGLEEGSILIAEEHEEGILLRPATVVALEIYTDERIAEFLLSNAIDAEDYARAVEEVRKLGLDPDDISHYKPEGV